MDSRTILSQLKLRAKIHGSCWLWNGAKTFNGYGRVSVVGRGTLRVHRYAYEAANSPIPPGLLVLHTCDNRLCFNPKHLFLGTYKDNSEDMKAKGRSPKNRTGQVLSPASKAKLSASLRKFHASRKGAH